MRQRWCYAHEGWDSDGDGRCGPFESWLRNREYNPGWEIGACRFYWQPGERFVKSRPMTPRWGSDWLRPDPMHFEMRFYPLPPPPERFPWTELRKRETIDERLSDFLGC